MRDKISESSDANLRVKKLKDTAAGLPSILNSLKRSFREMGAIRATRALLKLNQKNGIDCQSCAWPDPEHRTVSEFCENGAKALADEATRKIVDAEFFSRYSIAELLTRDPQLLNAQGRISEPMILREGAEHYAPIEWSEAFQIIADELNALSSPDEAIFYTSGRTSNEAAFLYQLFVRMFGTNNLPDCSNMCHESTSVALAESIGLGKATVRLDDLENTDLVIIIGQNPGTNAPRMMSSLETAKQKGAKIISINPLPEAGLMNFVNPNPQHHSNPLKFAYALLANRAVQLTDLHLPIRIGGDIAILKGIMKNLAEWEAQNRGSIFDRKFIVERTEGFEAFLSNLDKISWSDIEEQSGIARDEIRAAAEMYRAANRVVTCWAMGITQHKHAVATIQDIVNFHLLRGNIGRQGAGLLPVRGHSNVQGDRTMGIWEKINPTFRENLEREFAFETPKRDGFNTVEAITAMHERRAKVFFALGGNFAAATPDSEYTERALRNCSLTVQVITKLNRSALVTGKRALILPCLGRSEKDIQESGEQFVSTENTTLNVQMSKGVLEPASAHLRSEVWIVAHLASAVFARAKGDVRSARVSEARASARAQNFSEIDASNIRTCVGSQIDWNSFASNYDLIRDAISRVVPGFENYNERIRKPGGFYLPNPPREGNFSTPNGRAIFTASALPRIDLKPGELLMTTIRAHDQFNTTIYENNDRYRGISGSRRVIFMNEEDIALRGLKSGAIVDLKSNFENHERRAEKFVVVPYKIPRRCAATYFPEANSLVPISSIAEKSNCPTSKLTIITVESRS